MSRLGAQMKAAKDQTDLSRLPDWPRLMKRETAAAYLDVSTNRLDELRRSGLISYVGHGIKLFDRKKIDASLDELSGLRGPQTVPLRPAGSLGIEPQRDASRCWGLIDQDRPIILKIEEIAARWGVNHQAVRRLIRAGDIHAFKVGKLYRVREDALKEFEDRTGISAATGASASMSYHRMSERIKKLISEAPSKKSKPRKSYLKQHKDQSTEKP